jgi:hypothetical protein
MEWNGVEWSGVEWSGVYDYRINKDKEKEGYVMCDVSIVLARLR